MNSIGRSSRALRIPLLLFFASLALEAHSAVTSFAGANSFFLHALRPSDQAQVLDSMAQAGFKVVRIFVSEIGANAKGSNSIAIPDLESRTVGSYDDTILNYIDSLMYEVYKRKMKLIIAMHDRYSLGCWATDAYVAKYKIPTADCGKNPQQNDVINFYRNSNAAADMDRRFAHILAHRNRFFNNKPWSSIPEAIFGFDIQNEGLAHSANGVIANRNWICERATRLRPQLPGTGILILTGGGADVWDSVIDEHFRCPAIDVVCVHSYNPSALGNLWPYIQKARDSGKRLMVEEFGATGGNKAAGLQSQIDSIAAQGLPWAMWQVMKPNNQGDYEVFTDDRASWSVMSNGARAALAKQNGAFAWPEIDQTGPAPGPSPNPSTCGTCSSPICAGGNKCAKCNLAQAQGGCLCNSNCDCLQGSCWTSSGPTPSPSPTPTPSPSPSDTSGPCAKCNLSLCRGGCKCNSQCGCLLGGNKCDKCNRAQSEGGCKCNSNCDCIQGSCWA